jgi:predicted DNA binding CopG/RHH family protein
MKIYLHGTITESGIDKKSFEKLYQEIESLGYEHTDTETLEQALKDSSTLNTSSEDNQIKNYNRIVNAIKKADICIFETSALNFTTGFLINTALDQQKPTIVLHLKGSKPYFLSGVQNEKLMIQEYSEKNLKKLLQNILELAREKRDKRFNFFISPKLLEFLQTTSGSEGITKSKYIRNLIVEHMRENQA